MKRKITKLFALLLVGGAFMLAGCGNNSGLNVNVDGNYQDSTKEVFTTYVEQVDDNKKFDVPGYEFSLVTESTGDTKIKVTTSGKIVKTINEGGEEDAIAYFNMKSELDGQKMDFNSYVANGYFYTEVNGVKVKESLSKLYDDDQFSQIMTMIPSKSEITEMFTQFEKLGNVSVKVSQDGEMTKYMVAFENSTSEGSMAMQVYYVFKSDAIYGLKMISNANMDSEVAKITLDIQVYDGTIELPSFDDYIEA